MDLNSRGTQMMIKALLSALGIEPQRMFSTVEEIGKSLHNAATDMATLRRQNDAIMKHLGLTLEEGQTNDRAAVTDQAVGGSAERSAAADAA